MQARRRVEPTGTNRPTGLIAPVIRVRETRHEKIAACRRDHSPSRHSARPSPKKDCGVPVWWPERRAQNPIPSRTRPLNTPAPMVLCLKARESRSPPDPHTAIRPTHDVNDADPTPAFPRHARSPAAPPPHGVLRRRRDRRPLGAGWSSPVARQAHNLKVTGSNPVPATIIIRQIPPSRTGGCLCLRPTT